MGEHRDGKGSVDQDRERRENEGSEERREKRERGGYMRDQGLLGLY